MRAPRGFWRWWTNFFVALSLVAFAVAFVMAVLMHAQPASAPARLVIDGAGKRIVVLDALPGEWRVCAEGVNSVCIEVAQLRSARTEDFRTAWILADGLSFVLVVAIALSGVVAMVGYWSGRRRTAQPPVVGAKHRYVGRS